MSDVRIYGLGLVNASVCTPKEMAREQVEAAVNELHPTGIASPWKIATELFFADGVTPIPGPCNDDDTRLHWLLHC